jgi:hypothetical protein
MSDLTVGNNPLSAAMADVEGMRTDRGESTGDAADHFLHAKGWICKNCDHRIEARQPARRKGEDGWVHDVCPPSFD